MSPLKHPHRGFFHGTTKVQAVHHVLANQLSHLEFPIRPSLAAELSSAIAYIQKYPMGSFTAQDSLDLDEQESIITTVSAVWMREGYQIQLRFSAQQTTNPKIRHPQPFTWLDIGPFYSPLFLYYFREAAIPLIQRRHQRMRVLLQYWKDGALLLDAITHSGPEQDAQTSPRYLIGVSQTVSFKNRRYPVVITLDLHDPKRSYPPTEYNRFLVTPYFARNLDDFTDLDYRRPIPLPDIGRALDLSPIATELFLEQQLPIEYFDPKLRALL